MGNILYVKIVKMRFTPYAGMNISTLVKTFLMQNLTRSSNRLFFKMLTIVLLAHGYVAIANAQDEKVEIDIGVNREPVWYQQPWAWVLGAAIFILLLVALLRGSRKR
jgi:hypothetical protein